MCGTDYDVSGFIIYACGNFSLSFVMIIYTTRLDNVAR